MACHKHGRGSSFITFGTDGLGLDFIGSSNGNRPATGKAVLDVFCSYASRTLFTVL